MVDGFRVEEGGDRGGTRVGVAAEASAVEIRNNILDANATGMKAESGALIHNDYNLLHNSTNVDGVTAVLGDVEFRPVVVVGRIGPAAGGLDVAAGSPVVVADEEMAGDDDPVEAHPHPFGDGQIEH